MKKLIAQAFSIFILISFSQNAFAKGAVSVFLGVGELYSFSSARVAVSSYELGMYNLSTYAVTKNFYNGNTYVAFGPAIVKNGFGLYGGAGYDYSFMSLFFLRGEINVSASVTNYSEGSGIVGAGLYW